MAYAYTVKGSEDGILGVFGNLKRAKECAQEYTETEVLDHKLGNKNFGDFMWVYEGDRVKAEVEKFELE